MTKKRTVRIIGLPMDLGQSQRGVDMGPSAVRYAGLSNRLRELGYLINDAGNVEIRVRDSLQKSQYVSEIKKACEKLYDLGREAIKKNEIPLFLGGDHSIAIGSIGGITHDRPAGVIWIDAHGDYNTPEISPSGNIHGMALSVLLGNGDPELVNLGRPGPKLRPDDVVLIGIRSLDPQEKKRLSQSGITIYTMRDIDELGVSHVANDAVMRLSHLSHIHVSLDLDGLDPMEAPGVGTPVPGGLSFREAHLIMEIIADSKRMGSLDLVEINPILDTYNKTGQIAVDLAVSLFGKRIL
jgi:arginase